MSLADVLDGIRGVVAGIVPTYDPGQRYTVRQGNDPQALEDANVCRLVEVVASGPANEGLNITGGAVSYALMPIAVNVLYPASAFPSAEMLALAMAGDAIDLRGTLRPPSAWSTWAHSLLVDDATVSAIQGDGVVVAQVLTIPLRAEWEV